MEKKLCGIIALSAVMSLNGQVGINTTTVDAGAALEVVSTSKGVLLPRLSSHTDVANPTPGLVVYDISDQCVNFYTSTGWFDPCSGSAGLSLCSEDQTYPEVTDVDLGSTTGTIGVANGDLMYVGADADYFNSDIADISGAFTQATVVKGTNLSNLWPDGTVTDTSQYLVGGTHFFGVIADGKAYVTNSTNGFFELTGITGTPKEIVIRTYTSSNSGALISVLTEEGDVFYKDYGSTISTITSSVATTQATFPQSIDRLGATIGTYYYGADGVTTYHVGYSRFGTSNTGSTTFDPITSPGVVLTNNVIDAAFGGSSTGLFATSTGDLYYKQSGNAAVLLDLSSVIGTEKVVQVALDAGSIRAAILTDAGHVYSFITNGSIRPNDPSGWYKEDVKNIKELEFYGAARSVMLIDTSNHLITYDILQSESDQTVSTISSTYETIAADWSRGVAEDGSIASPVYVPICIDN